MPYWIALLLFCVHANSFAARNDTCTSSWRVGQRVIKVGDDVGRSLKSLDRVSHYVDWLRGPNSSKWTLVTTGYNAKTVQIQVKNGRLQKICQYQ